MTMVVKAHSFSEAKFNWTVFLGILYFKYIEFKHVIMLSQKEVFQMVYTGIRNMSRTMYRPTLKLGCAGYNCLGVHLLSAGSQFTLQFSTGDFCRIRHPLFLVYVVMSKRRLSCGTLASCTSIDKWGWIRNLFG